MAKMTMASRNAMAPSPTVSTLGRTSAMPRVSPAKASHIVAKATSGGASMAKLSFGNPISHTQHSRSGRC